MHGLRLRRKRTRWFTCGAIISFSLYNVTPRPTEHYAGALDTPLSREKDMSLIRLIYNDGNSKKVLKDCLKQDPKQNEQLQAYREGKT
jgi:hypothetical protein